MGQFNGGLNTLADAAKLAPGEYALLVNGRTRRNVIDPTFAHLKITLPAQGNIQGLCGVGEQLFVMIAGVLYYANVGDDDINLRQVPNWTPMSATAEEVWMEPVPATSNLLKRVASSPETVSTSFDGSIARFRECIVVQDGLNTPRAVFPNLGWTSLGSYSTWTFDNPVYVPVGRQMAYSNGKLYVVSQDGKTIYHSVSGRPTDFVIAIDNNGNKAGDVDVTSIGVSYTELTALKASESGQLIATTLYGTWLLTPSDAITYWGEPYITPIEQFPVGATNQNAFAVKRVTGFTGRSARGRVFFPLCIAYLGSNEDLMDATSAETVRASLEEAIDAGIADGWLHVLVSRQQDGIVPEEAVTRIITGYELSDLEIDSQRRRMPSK